MFKLLLQTQTSNPRLAAFMGDPASHLLPDGSLDTSAVERSCEQLLSSMPLQSYALVIRCGAAGCYIAKNGGRLTSLNRSSSTRRKKRRNHARGGLTLDMDMEALFAGLLGDGDGGFEREEVEIDPGIERWLPAFFTPEDEKKVVDPTGGGNGFLGGLAVGLARGKEVVEAAACGSVSASFMIEQVGVPLLRVAAEEGGDAKERWNGASVQERLEEFRVRCGGW
jgi:hypothetical protein